MVFDIRDGNLTYKHIVDERPLAERENFREHFHTDYELLYFLHGDAEFIIEQNSYRLRPHSLLVIKPGEHHNLVVKSDNKYYERMVLRFNSADVPESVDRLLQGLASVYDIAGTRLSELFFQLDTHCEQIEGPLITELLKSARMEILIYLCCRRNTVQKAEFVNEYIGQIIAFIDRNLVAIRSLDNIAASLHLSRSTINRLFYAQVNVPVMSYVRTKKCMLAHSMLLSGLSPTIVSERCGFNDYSSFYRAYLKVFRHAPSEDAR